LLDYGTDLEGGLNRSQLKKTLVGATNLKEKLVLKKLFLGAEAAEEN
jgi:hypothetical protein